MTTYKCIRCGKENLYSRGETVCKCENCHSSLAMPVVDDASVAGMYSSATDLFRVGEFDQAAVLYNHILEISEDDAVAHWMLVLCTYGILYFRDSDSEEWKPTIKKYQPVRVMDDKHYNKAIQLCDNEQRELFAAYAANLEKIREGIEVILKKEEPVDVFISYKETDDHTMKKTHDSTYARMLYNRLNSEGYKVFYAPFTLLNKPGEQFEPYIYAALHSAKTMVVIGTRVEYFNAPWIRNEWGRYLPLAKDPIEKRKLIPVCRDMNYKELPDELRAFQAIEMDNVNDWVGMILEKVKENTGVERLYNNNGLLHHAFLLLGKGKFKKADQKCEQALDVDPTNAMAYIGKLMAELEVKTLQDLSNAKEPYDSYENYQEAMKYGDEAIQEMLLGFIDEIKERNEYNRNKAIYDNAMKKMKEDTLGGYKEAIKILRSISTWEDAKEQIGICEQRRKQLKAETYEKAVDMLKNAATRREYSEVSKVLSTINSYRRAGNLLSFSMIGAMSSSEEEKNKQFNELFVKENEKVEKLKKENALMDVALHMHWTITFGRYVQDGDEATPIVWRVLDKKEDMLLVISEFILDCLPYNDMIGETGWKDCTLRQWLNNEFLNKAFNEEEREMIRTVENIDNPISGTKGVEDTQGKVFLLSTDEASRYLMDDKERVCMATAHALEVVQDNNERYGIDRCYRWWLRSLGKESNSASHVQRNGNLECISVLAEDVGVRPALWLELSH